MIYMYHHRVGDVQLVVVSTESLSKWATIKETRIKCDLIAKYRDLAPTKW